MIQFAEAVLTHPDIDDRDARLVILLFMRQNENGQVTQEEIAKVMGISKPTVERRIRGLKSKGLLSSERKGSHAWTYDFGSIAPTIDLEQSHCTITQVMGHNTKTHLRLVKCDTETDEVAHHPGDPSPHVIITKNNNKETKKEFHGKSPEEVMPPVTGPNGPLKDVIEKSLSSSKKEKSNKPQRRKRLSQMEHMQQKNPENFNCNDMWYIFKQAWFDRSWASKPTGWTQRDRKHVKELIEEQGAIGVITLFQHVFGNWESLSKRYKVNGYPSIPLIFGFRRSWVPEALDGDNDSGANAEFVETDIPSGSWG